MLRKIGRVLYKIFVYPLVWPFMWIRMKWAWRGIAPVTQKDWEKAVQKIADREGESLIPEPVNGDPQQVTVDGKRVGPEFWAKQKVLTALNSDPALAEARDLLTRARWPQSVAPNEPLQEEAMRELCKKHGITYEDFVSCVTPTTYDDMKRKGKGMFRRVGDGSKDS